MASSLQRQKLIFEEHAAGRPQRTSDPSEPTDMSIDPAATTRSSRALLLAIAAFLCAACEPLSTAPPDPAPGGPAAESEPPQSGGQQRETPSGALELGSEQVDTLFVSVQSGATTALRQVVRSADAWETVWAELSGPFVGMEAAPEVDFAASQVLVLAMGARPTGGYSIEVGTLSLAEGVLSVPVREVTPGSSCVNTQAVTQPALVLRVPLLGDAVEFVEEQAVLDCA